MLTDTTPPAERVAQLIDRAAAAKKLNVHPRTLARMERSGRLRAVKMSARLTRYLEVDINHLIAASLTGAAAA